MKKYLAMLLVFSMLLFLSVMVSAEENDPFEMKMTDKGWCESGNLLTDGSFDDRNAQGSWVDDICLMEAEEKEFMGFSKIQPEYYGSNNNMTDEFFASCQVSTYKLSPVISAAGLSTVYTAAGELLRAFAFGNLETLNPLWIPYEMTAADSE